MRHITNKEFEEALSNKDNLQIIKYVCNKFSKQLSQEVLKCCGQRGLWQCLRWHDSSIKKFTSSLYKTVKLECFKELNQIKIKKYKNKTTFSLDSNQTIYNSNKYDYSLNRDIKNSVSDNMDFISNTENILEIEDLLKNIPQKHALILKDRFIFNMKLKELAEKYNCSRQSISIIIFKSIKAIKEKFGVSLDKETNS